MSKSTHVEVENEEVFVPYTSTTNNFIWMPRMGDKLVHGNVEEIWKNPEEVLIEELLAKVQTS